MLITCNRSLITFVDGSADLTPRLPKIQGATDFQTDVERGRRAGAGLAAGIRMAGSRLSD